MQYNYQVIFPHMLIIKIKCHFMYLYSLHQLLLGEEQQTTTEKKYNLISCKKGWKYHFSVSYGKCQFIKC